METKELLARWHVLRNETGGVTPSRAVLQERLVILHRLNELGINDIDGVSIFPTLEATNASMREIDRVDSRRTVHVAK